LSNASTTATSTYSFWAQTASGVAIDVTFRIGGPQFENSALATSLILTTSGAVTRAADAAAFVNEPAGPIIVEWINETTGVTSRSLFAAGTFGSSFTTANRYRQIAAYKPGTSTAYLNTRLTVGAPF
jgi:hypothetical protein